MLATIGLLGLSACKSDEKAMQTAADGFYKSMSNLDWTGLKNYLVEQQHELIDAQASQYEMLLKAAEKNEDAKEQLEMLKKQGEEGYANLRIDSCLTVAKDTGYCLVRMCEDLAQDINCEVDTLPLSKLSGTWRVSIPIDNSPEPEMEMSPEEFEQQMRLLDSLRQAGALGN